jgi:hypothetical protein
MIAPGDSPLVDIETIMMKSLLTTLLLVLAIGAAPQALAGQYEFDRVAIADSKDRRDLRIAQSNGPTLSEAVEMVKRQCKCRIVDARTKTSGGGEVHVIKFMTNDGTVKTRQIPGRSKP